MLRGYACRCFRLEHVPRGAVEVTVAAEGFVTAGTRIDAAMSATDLTLRVQRGGRLVAVLRDPAGTPVADVGVHVHAPTRPEPSATGTWEWATSDANGRVEVRLVAGTYRLEVMRNAKELASLEVVLEEGKDTTVEVQVPAR